MLAWMWVMWKHLIHSSWQLAILGHRLALSWSNPSPRWLCMSLLNHYPSAVQGKWGLAHYMLRVNLPQAIRSLSILCFPLSVIHICSLTTTLNCCVSDNTSFILLDNSQFWLGVWMFQLRLSSIDKVIPLYFSEITTINMPQIGCSLNQTVL